MNQDRPHRLSDVRAKLTRENPTITVDFSCLTCNRIVLNTTMLYAEYIAGIDTGFFKTKIPRCKEHPNAKVFFDGYFPV